MPEGPATGVRGTPRPIAVHCRTTPLLRRRDCGRSPPRRIRPCAPRRRKCGACSFRRPNTGRDRWPATPSGRRSRSRRATTRCSTSSRAPQRIVRRTPAIRRCSHRYPIRCTGHRLDSRDRSEDPTPPANLCRPTPPPESDRLARSSNDHEWPWRLAGGTTEGSVRRRNWRCAVADR